MSNIENVSRRKFLKGLGIGSGALVLGVQFSGLMPIAHAAASGSYDKSFMPNVYVQIGKDDIVSIVVHRSEMGQGIRTSIPMIVADELDADWQKIAIIQGLADEKYGSQNTDGSRSIRRFYQPLREAGASARMIAGTIFNFAPQALFNIIAEKVATSRGLSLVHPHSSNGLDSLLCRRGRSSCTT